MGVVVVEVDVFEFENDIVMHQCNCRNRMGRGIADTIKKKYPEAYKADSDLEVPLGRARLGKFSWAWVDNNKFRIFNLYGQDNYYGEGVLTEYDRLEDSVRRVFDLLSKEGNFKDLKIGIPYGLGSRLAKGNWDTVRDIFERVSEEYGKTVYACKKDI